MPPHRLAERGRDGSRGLQSTDGGIVITRRGATDERRCTLERSAVAPRLWIVIFDLASWTQAHGYHRCLAPRDRGIISKLQSGDMSRTCPCSPEQRNSLVRGKCPSAWRSGENAPRLVEEDAFEVHFQS